MNNKDLIRQYVDTGQPLPKYQVDQLGNSLRQTYLRKRMVATDHSDFGLRSWEYLMLNPQQQATFMATQRIDVITHMFQIMPEHAKTMAEVLLSVVNKRPYNEPRTYQTIMYYCEDKPQALEHILSLVPIEEYETLGYLIKYLDNATTGAIQLCKLYMNRTHSRISAKLLEDIMWRFKDGNQNATQFLEFLLPSLKFKGDDYLSSEYWNAIFSVAPSRQRPAIGDAIQKFFRLRPSQRLYLYGE